MESISNRLLKSTPVLYRDEAQVNEAVRQPSFQFSPAMKGGKLGKTSHHGHLTGQIIHAIPGNPANGFWGTPALCGAKPRKSGYGWLGMNGSPVDCPKCLLKVKQGNQL